MEDFPSNSQKRVPAKKDKQVEEQRVERVVSGSVSRQKKSIGRRFADTFFGGRSSKEIVTDVVQDVLIPDTKTMIFDAAMSAVEERLFGQSRPRGRSVRPGNTAWTAYNKVAGSTLRPESGRPGLSNQAKSRHNFDELAFENRVDAVEVLNSLYAIIEEYDVARVRDLYDLVGETPSYTDEKFGWTDLEGAGVRRARNGGWVLILPSTELIN